MVRIDRPLGKTSSPTSSGFPSEMPREEKNQEREWAQGENAQLAPFGCCWTTAVRESCRDLGEHRPEHGCYYWPAKGAHMTSMAPFFCALLPMSTLKTLKILQGLMTAYSTPTLGPGTPDFTYPVLVHQMQEWSLELCSPIDADTD